MAPPDPLPRRPRLPRRRAGPPWLRRHHRSTFRRPHQVHCSAHRRVIALIDAIGADKVFVVGHDWGAIVAWRMCLFRPDRVKALVNFSVHFTRRNPHRKTMESFRDAYGDDRYICRFQESGEIEGVFANLGAKQVIKKFLTYRDPLPFYFPKDKPVGDADHSAIVLPSWLTEEDINYYTKKFEQTGFTGGVNYYRCFDLNWELEAPWTNAKVNVPVKFVIGDLDLVYNIPGVKEYIHNGGFHEDVPLLDEVVGLKVQLTSSLKKSLMKSANTSLTSSRSSKTFRICSFNGPFGSMIS